MTTNFKKEKQTVVDRMLAMDDFGMNDTEISLLLPYKVPREHITMTERIANGANAEVWIGNCRGRKVAIKRKFVAHGDVQMRDIEAFKRECLVMAQLQQGGVSHPNIAQMLYCWNSSLLLILDYYVLGSLREVLDVNIRMPNWYGEELCWVNPNSSQKGTVYCCVEYMRWDELHS